MSETSYDRSRTRKVGVAVAGLGRMGRVHAENIACTRAPAQLISVTDVDVARAQSIGHRLSVNWTARFEDMLNDPGVEAIVVATPTDTHPQLVGDACAAGKHVFCEKPLSVNVDESIRLVGAAQETGVQLQVGLHMRFDPVLATVAERARAGELGAIYLFTATLRDKQPPAKTYLEKSGGFVLDGGIHTLDLARHIGGEVEEVTALGTAVSDPMFTELGDLDGFVISLRFANGGLGVLEHSRVAGYGFDCRVEIVGSRRTAWVAGHGLNSLEWLDPEVISNHCIADSSERFPAAYQLEVDSFVRAIALDVPVRASGEDAVAAAQLCDAAARSIRDRRPITVGSELVI